MVLFYVCPGSFSATEEVFGLIHSVRVEDRNPSNGSKTSQ